MPSLDIKMQKFNLNPQRSRRRRRQRAANKKFKKIQEARKKKQQETDDAEIEQLSTRLWPMFGQPKEEIAPSSIKAFSDLPISRKTLDGLKAQNFITPTEIQRESLMYGLRTHDIRGAAKTGSGKTLAFLIPILETLFKQKFTPSFGLAALVISPTRELAFQTFDVLKKIGKFHDLSFGLAIGGKNLEAEARTLDHTNVLVCTPGRLQQHFEQTPYFTADHLRILVLDEADKILELGFAETMNAIIEALPKQRQTLLFSATLSKSVKALSKLSLKRPVFVSALQRAKEVTPTSLCQGYIVCKMEDKISTLWTFISCNKAKKILVFVSTCKQTRYIYQVFRKMHPGVTILCLHGHLKQHQRMEVYNSFCRKQHAVLLATDVVARGLDFPEIRWVVQLDKPDNVKTYIHRVGRTARYNKVGYSLLMLLPSEEKKMVEDLQKKKIPIILREACKKSFIDISKKLESLCASDTELKDNAQKAFVASMKNLWVLNMASFESVDQERYAASLGLVQAPILPFVEKAKLKAESKLLANKAKEGSDEKSTDNNEAGPSLSLPKKETPTLNFGVHDDDNEPFYVKDVKTDEVHDADDDAGQVTIQEERRSKKKKSRAREKLKLLKYTTRIVFDEDGNPEKKEQDDDDDKGGLNIAKAILRMKEQDKIDKEVQRQKIKQQHREKRLKLKEQRRQAEFEKRTKNAEREVVLRSQDDDDEDDNNDICNDEGSQDGAESESSEIENASSSDDEPKAKRQRVSLTADASSDEDSDEEVMDHIGSTAHDDDDDDEDTETDLKQDEDAVLALLRGK